MQTGRLAADDPEAIRRKSNGEDVLRLLDGHLARREFLVGDQYSIADTAVYGYTQVAQEAGYELERWPAVQAWLDRVAGQPGYVDDLQPYPPNARTGCGRSIYD